jgi:hypothetical protein
MATLKSVENVVQPVAPPSPADDFDTLNSIKSHAERALTRKLDLYIVPLIIVSYILIFLDRSNLGNAKIAGMPQELHLHGTEINCL